MAIALDDPPDGKIQQLRARVDGERNQGFASADFGQRRRHWRRYRRPQRDRRLSEGIGGRGEIDEFRIGKQRRAREHDRGNFGVVFRKREHHVMRHIRIAREILGKGAANERRGIVEEARQDKPYFLALAFRKAIIKKECARAPPRRRPAQPEKRS